MSFLLLFFLHNTQCWGLEKSTPSTTAFGCIDCGKILTHFPFQSESKFFIVNEAHREYKQAVGLAGSMSNKRHGNSNRREKPQLSLTFEHISVTVLDRESVYFRDCERQGISTRKMSDIFDLNLLLSFPIAPGYQRNRLVVLKTHIIINRDTVAYWGKTK